MDRPHLLPAPAPAAVVSKATVRAAQELAIPQRVLARALGLSPASTSRLCQGGYQLDPAQKPFELALLLLRVYRSLDAIAGGDREVSRIWLRADNGALGGAPLQLIETVPGLIHVLAYLDARRAVL